ncbi:kinesin-like protein KIF21B isoform X6 [Varroa destructor]|nr:kinesin-like protein KIF21B isoform X6 [Varroa destructor]
MCHVCTRVPAGEPAVVLGKEKAFTFDRVFDISSSQDIIYNNVVKDLVDGCLQGYNATVLAYGQTGSGKTYTMGTGFDVAITLQPADRGLIPRAVEQLFRGMDEARQTSFEKGVSPPQFHTAVQFMELYNEDIKDLLSSGDKAGDGTAGRRGAPKITEENGQIVVQGVTVRAVHSAEEVLQCLHSGALARTTASTNMNSQSSRSHAIFTLIIRQQKFLPGGRGNDEEGAVTENDMETLTAKFHFVDLAGSERIKRTGATGVRAKEGIKINCGLLALGNVISALADVSKRATHVPYRDSKLTRLLQDSLGGNSRTLMIACVSPADRDFMETLNTLKYANRAKNIKNRVCINQDKSSQTILALRKEIEALQLELLEYRQGKRIVAEDGTFQTNDMFQENQILLAENQNLRTRLKALKETVDRLKVRNAELLNEKAAHNWVAMNDDQEGRDIIELQRQYIKEIEELKTKLIESEEMRAQLQKAANSRVVRRVSNTGNVATLGTSMAGSMISSLLADDTPGETCVEELIHHARKEVRRLKKRARPSSHREKEENGGVKSDGDEDTSLKSEANGATPGSGGSGDNSDEISDDDFSDDDEEEDQLREYSAEMAGITQEISIKNLKRRPLSPARPARRPIKRCWWFAKISRLRPFTCSPGDLAVERLIEELEKSQRRICSMRSHYEEKLLQLQIKIKETEMERDKVLNAMASKNQSQAEVEEAKKIREDFEKKLNNLQAELKQMQDAKRRHAQLVKEQEKQEKVIREYRQQLEELKKTKAELMRKIREEGKRHKEQEMRVNKELCSLKREARQTENRIKTLEAENRAKENVLKRKQEEVNALRRQAVTKINGGVPYGRSGKPQALQTRIVKDRWKRFEKNIDKMVLNKQAIHNIERDMERYLLEREKLERVLDRTIRKRDRALAQDKDESLLRDLDDEIDNLNSNIGYLQDNIMECQTNICQIEENKELPDQQLLDVNELIAGMAHVTPDAKFLMEKLLAMTVNQSMQAAQKTAEAKELEARLEQVENNYSQTERLLQMTIETPDKALAQVMEGLELQGGQESQASSRSVSPAESIRSDISSATYIVPGERGKTFKARRRTPTCADLLFNDGSEAGNASIPRSDSIPLMDETEPPSFFGTNPNNHIVTTPIVSHTPPHSHIPRFNSTVAPHGLPNTGGAHKDIMSRSFTSYRDVLITRNHPTGGLGASSGPSRLERHHPLLDPTPSGLPRKRDPLPAYATPLTQRRRFSHSLAASPGNLTVNSNGSGHHPSGLLSSLGNARVHPTFGSNDLNYGNRLHQHPLQPHVTDSTGVNSSVGTAGGSAGDQTPPASPSVTRKMFRSTDANVFTRLAGGQTSTPPMKERGVISMFTGRASSKSSSSPLICTHTAEGHNKAVLSLAVTSDVLFSASKDRTVKVWDLRTGQELQTVRGHPDNVTVVRYSEYSRLAFSASTAYVRVWDLRESPAKCVKTLCSSGSTMTSLPSSERDSRVPTGEQRINAVELNHFGSVLFAASGSTVKTWDLRRFATIGKLVGGHTAPVMCLAVDDVALDTNYVATGSKDHYVKVFETAERPNGVVQPKMNLEPPHYDGISSLAMCNDFLYSGSRDMCLKKWDLTNCCLLQSINQAHKDWITAMATLPPSSNSGGQYPQLLTSCRGGLLKMWNTETMQNIGELKAHTTPINAIASNGECVFTASNGCDIKIWQRSRGSSGLVDAEAGSLVTSGLADWTASSNSLSGAQSMTASFSALK